MIVNHRRQIGLTVCAALALGLFAVHSSAQEPLKREQFKLESTTFSNNTTLPITMILNNTVNGVNACSPNGAAGYDESPQLYWTGAPRGTHSFVVVLYDVTAGFTHWGMYNISDDVTELPENAGRAGSSYGKQITNDFGIGQEYDGPCPPVSVAPDTHQYQFTVYALCTDLKLPGSANFPANAEMLYHALLAAGARGEILGKASLTGLYSATPSTN